MDTHDCCNLFISNFDIVNNLDILHMKFINAIKPSLLVN